MSEEIIPCQLYLITPPQIPDLPAFLKQLDAALSAAPVACLQIRLKDEGQTGDGGAKNGEDEPQLQDSSARIQTMQAILDTARNYDTVVLINDDPNMAVKLGADGVHLGQDDMAYSAARALLPERAIIGVTCHNSKDLAFEAANSGADYVAFGAFFDTSTKTPKTRAELEILTWWNEAVEIPCVAIGGITVDNAAQVIDAGADFIAVCSGVWDYKDGPAAAVTALSQLL